MAFDVGTIKATLDFETGQFKGGIDAAVSALGGFKGAAKGAEEAIGGVFSALDNVLHGNFLGGFRSLQEGVTGLIKGVFETLGEASNAAAEFEEKVERLDVALQLRGLQSYSEDLIGLAEAQQQVTAFGRNATISVESQLAVFGVGKGKLEEYTKAVEDYAAATGIDAETAANQLIRTLAGVAPRMGPLKVLTDGMSQSTLRAGGAFEVLRQRLGGFAQDLANTVPALESRLKNAVTEALSNLGEIVNPTLKVFLNVGRELVEQIGNGIKANKGPWTSAFADLISTAVGYLQKVLTFIPFIPPAFEKAFNAIKFGALETISAIEIRLDKFILGFQQQVAAIAGSKAGQLFGLDFDKAETAVVAAKQHLEAAEQSARGLADAMDQAAKQEDLAAVNAERISSEIKSGLDTGNAFYNVLGQAYQATTQLQTGLQGVADETESVHDGLNRVGSDLQGATNYASRMKAEVDKINQGVTQAAGLSDKAGRSWDQLGFKAADAAGSVKDVASATDKAATSADKLASKMSSVASSAQAAADSFSATAGGFGEFGKDDFGSLGKITQGGTAKFDTSSAAATQALINKLSARASTLSDIYGSKSNADAFISQLTAKLQGQLQDEQKAFVSAIIDQLDRQGIWDPAARNTYISQQFDEARRLGTLPRGITYDPRSASVY